jgi:16S rRNA (guanine1207-N2)-methyltransferase
VGTSQYFEPQPSVRTRPRTVVLNLPDRALTLATDSGVFAADAVDPGTRYLLLDAPAPPPTGDILDLGCGYGPIALAVAARSPGATVWAVDVNERALALCRRNAEQAGLANVRVASPDDVPAAIRFAAAYSNPPIRIGKAPLHSMLLQWLERLDAGAHAYLVVQKHLGSDSLARWLAGEGWTVTRLGSRLGYRLLDVGRA